MGWFSPLNGYQYRIILFKFGWSAAQGNCGSLDGYLASVGVQDMGTRQ